MCISVYMHCDHVAAASYQSLFYIVNCSLDLSGDQQSCMPIKIKPNIVGSTKVALYQQ